jgi:hypothetical protein
VCETHLLRNCANGGNDAGISTDALYPLLRDLEILLAFVQVFCKSEIAAARIPAARERETHNRGPSTTVVSL